MSNYNNNGASNKKGITENQKKIIIASVIVGILLIAVIVGVVMSSADNGSTGEKLPNQFDGTNPQATIEMENGDKIVIELYPNNAPNTVDNFISLANNGFYDGLKFHRVIEGFMLQGGCPQGTGTGNPGYSIAGEFTKNDFENTLVHERGVISMARSNSMDSAGSQFFIMHQAAPHLDGVYAGFGKVIEGMDIVDEIATCEKNGEKPVVDQKIKTITIDTFGEEFPQPVIIE